MYRVCADSSTTPYLPTAGRARGGGASGGVCASLARGGRCARWRRVRGGVRPAEGCACGRQAGGGAARRATGKYPACVCPLVALPPDTRQHTPRYETCHALSEVSDSTAHPPRRTTMRRTHPHCGALVGVRTVICHMSRVHSLFCNALHEVLRGGDAAHSYRQVDAGLEVHAALNLLSRGLPAEPFGSNSPCTPWSSRSSSKWTPS